MSSICESYYTNMSKLGYQYNQNVSVLVAFLAGMDMLWLGHNCFCCLSGLGLSCHNSLCGLGFDYKPDLRAFCHHLIFSLFSMAVYCRNSLPAVFNCIRNYRYCLVCSFDISAYFLFLLNVG